MQYLKKSGPNITPDFWNILLEQGMFFFVVVRLE